MCDKSKTNRKPTASPQRKSTTSCRTSSKSHNKLDIMSPHAYAAAGLLRLLIRRSGTRYLTSSEIRQIHRMVSTVSYSTVPHYMSPQCMWSERSTCILYRNFLHVESDVSLYHNSRVRELMNIDEMSTRRTFLSCPHCGDM